MRIWKRLIAGILSTAFVFGICPETGVLAAGSSASVELKFTGDEADLAGFAQSRITVTPGSSTRASGYFLVYYTDSTRVLPDYDQALFIKIDGENPVTGKISDKRMLPPGATGIAVFESDSHFMEEAPDLKDAIATAPIPAAKQTPSFGKAEFSFGTLSDTHMNYEQHDRGAYAKLEYAMNFYAEKNMELVVIAGDVTGDRGENPDLEAQYEKHLEILAASDFPADKVYEAIGNHGNTAADAPLLDQYLGGTDEIHPYKNSPYFHLLVNGKNGGRDNLFIFMAQEGLEKPGNSAKIDCFSKAQIDWLEDLLTQYGNTETNIFILEHTPFLNWGAGDIKNGGYTACITVKDEYPQTVRFYNLLKTYRDCIVMSGHTHVSFYDDANYSNENDTFSHTVHVGSSSQPCGYGTGTKLVRSYDGRKNVTPEYGSEGYTVQVYSDRIVYTGYNFSTGKKVPAACFIIPVEAEADTPPEEEEGFVGAGTLADPYLIRNEADFKLLTDSFSTSGVESEMFGYGKYFLQTADLDMTDVSGYSGTVANGNEKYFFAGIYNGAGHTIRVDIDGTVQRSVFPYVYGTICNLKIEGDITSETSAQPVRTLYGSIVNCIFNLNLSAKYANGILYSNYAKVYNVFTYGTVAGEKPHPVSNNDSSKDYGNVFHFYTSGGAAVEDECGARENDLSAIAGAFNQREGSAFEGAKEALGGNTMLEVTVKNGALAFLPAGLGDLDENGEVDLNDAIYLLYYVNFPANYPINQSVDFNNDGNSDLNDAIYLLYHVNFPANYPLS